MKEKKRGLDELMKLARERGQVVLWEPPVAPFAVWGPVNPRNVGARGRFKLVRP